VIPAASGCGQVSGRARAFGDARACIAGNLAAVPVGFLDRYRRRTFLPYLPPPSWVCTAPVHTVFDHVLLYRVDEMGKNNFLPIVYDDDYGPEAVARLLDPVLAAPAPGPREVRLIGDDAALRDRLAAVGFTVDRVQLCMSSPVTARRLPTTHATVVDGSWVDDDELAAHQNVCFGLRLTGADVGRMRQHADWSDSNLFAYRDAAGKLIATLRLVIDTLADGTPYGLLRGLGVHPRHRRGSVTVLSALYQAALSRAADAGVRRCHLLVDATGGARRTAGAMFEYLGFRTETVMYRMRQKPSATPV
jgi:hypothetical protein